MPRRDVESVCQFVKPPTAPDYEYTFLEIYFLSVLRYTSFGWLRYSSNIYFRGGGGWSGVMGSLGEFDWE